ncbi:MAG: tyrosine-type recombinase/integrase [Gallionella sp.]
MAYKTIGNMVVEWEDNEPFIFSLSEDVGVKDQRSTKLLQCDLSALRSGFEDEFLLHLKDAIINRRHKAILNTIKSEYWNLELLFRRVIENGLFDKRISLIDESFLLALAANKDSFSKACLYSLKRYFNSNPLTPIFCSQLRGDDFPLHSDIKGHHGRKIDNILAKALTRAACVEILTLCDQAYEDDQMDIGHYSFVNLAFSVFVRPESYRRIRLDDFVYDTDEDAFFIYILPAKSRVNNPDKICYRINKHVGLLLQKQRQHVIETCSHLVDSSNINKIALFPARQLSKNNSRWRSEFANESFGQLADGAKFSAAYFRPILSKLKGDEVALNGTGLRHTVGTQLAQSGCSAKTIAAVLKHAGNQSCQAYVDIAFHGLMNELSDAMRPAFEDHFPVFSSFRSTGDPIQNEKAILSEDIESGRTELTGECGKQISCQFAPFTCYECNKFIPCYDADHSVNLDIVQREIDEYKNAGTAYRQMVKKAQTIKIHIQLVIAACVLYQQTYTNQKRPQ